MRADLKNFVGNLLNQDYEILFLETVGFFLTSPVNKLYQHLQLLRRNTFLPNQRIVLIDNVLNTEKQAFYNYLRQVLINLDITSFFVLVVSNDSAVENLLTQSAILYPSDKTTIQFKKISCESLMIDTVTNFNLPSTLCVNPWINLEISIEGRVSPCCLFKSNQETSDSIIHKSLFDIISNEQNKNVRLEFLNGEKIPECKKCWDEEKVGKRSKRLQDNYVFRDKIFDVDWNNTDEPDLISLDIKLKNTCNLSCRICNPVSSSKWYDEVIQHPKVYSQYQNLKNIKAEWTDDVDSTFWRDLVKIGKNLRYITFAGGEPLLDKNHRRLLQYLIDIGISNKVYLHYNTNGSVYADKLIPLWDQFKTVELSFSIDNVGEKFEYERYGTTWKTVIDNISQYQKLDRNIYVLNIYNVVTALNVLDMYDLYKFFTDKQLPVTMSILEKPIELNIKILTKKQKEYIVTKFKNIDDTAFQEISHPILKYSLQSLPEVTIDNFVKYLETTDTVRNQDFKKTYTELNKLLLEIN